jgi:hypothetical protein
MHSNKQANENHIICYNSVSGLISFSEIKRWAYLLQFLIVAIRAWDWNLHDFVIICWIIFPFFRFDKICPLTKPTASYHLIYYYMIKLGSSSDRIKINNQTRIIFLRFWIKLKISLNPSISV